MDLGEYKMNEYPLYPELPDAGKEEAQALIDGFKKKLVDAAQEAIGILYTDVVVHIESDSWMNYRNEMMKGFKDYNNRKVQGEFDFKAIRKQIYKDFRADIINDLNQDMVDEIQALKTQLEIERNFNRERY